MDPLSTLLRANIRAMSAIIEGKGGNFEGAIFEINGMEAIDNKGGDHVLRSAMQSFCSSPMCFVCDRNASLSEVGEWRCNGRLLAVKRGADACKKWDNISNEMGAGMYPPSPCPMPATVQKKVRSLHPLGVGHPNFSHVV